MGHADELANTQSGTRSLVKEGDTLVVQFSSVHDGYTKKVCVTTDGSIPKCSCPISNTTVQVPTGVMVYKLSAVACVRDPNIPSSGTLTGGFISSRVSKYNLIVAPVTYPVEFTVTDVVVPSYASVAWKGGKGATIVCYTNTTGFDTASATAAVQCAQQGTTCVKGMPWSAQDSVPFKPYEGKSMIVAAQACSGVGDHSDVTVHLYTDVDPPAEPPVFLVSAGHIPSGTPISTLVDTGSNANTDQVCVTTSVFGSPTTNVFDFPKCADTSAQGCAVGQGWETATITQDSIVRAIACAWPGGKSLMLERKYSVLSTPAAPTFFPAPGEVGPNTVVAALVEGAKVCVDSFSQQCPPLESDSCSSSSGSTFVVGITDVTLYAIACVYPSFGPVLSSPISNGGYTVQLSQLPPPYFFYGGAIVGGAIEARAGGTVQVQSEGSITCVSDDGVNTAACTCVPQCLCTSGWDVQSGESLFLSSADQLPHPIKKDLSAAACKVGNDPSDVVSIEIVVQPDPLVPELTKGPTTGSWILGPYDITPGDSLLLNSNFSDYVCVMLVPGGGTHVVPDKLCPSSPTADPECFEASATVQYAFSVSEWTRVYAQGCSYRGAVSFVEEWDVVPVFCPVDGSGATPCGDAVHWQCSVEGGQRQCSCRRPFSGPDCLSVDVTISLTTSINPQQDAYSVENFLTVVAERVVENYDPVQCPGYWNWTLDGEPLPAAYHYTTDRLSVDPLSGLTTVLGFHRLQVSYTLAEGYICGSLPPATAEAVFTLLGPPTGGKLDVTAGDKNIQLVTGNWILSSGVTLSTCSHYYYANPNTDIGSVTVSHVEANAQLLDTGMQITKSADVIVPDPDDGQDAVSIVFAVICTDSRNLKGLATKAASVTIQRKSAEEVDDIVTSNFGAITVFTPSGGGTGHKFHTLSTNSQSSPTDRLVFALSTVAWIDGTVTQLMNKALSNAERDLVSRAQYQKSLVAAGINQDYKQVSVNNAFGAAGALVRLNVSSDFRSVCVAADIAQYLLAGEQIQVKLFSELLQVFLETCKQTNCEQQCPSGSMTAFQRVKAFEAQLLALTSAIPLGSCERDGPEITCRFALLSLADQRKVPDVAYGYSAEIAFIASSLQLQTSNGKYVDPATEVFVLLRREQSTPSGSEIALGQATRFAILNNKGEFLTTVNVQPRSVMLKLPYDNIAGADPTAVVQEGVASSIMTQAPGAGYISLSVSSLGVFRPVHSPCTQNPCQNGGGCVGTTTGSTVGFACTCQPGFSGTLCNVIAANPPSIVPSGGTWVDGTPIKINVEEFNPKICYTTDGTAPACTATATTATCTTGTVYTAPIPMQGNFDGTTWKAVVCKPGKGPSPVVTSVAPFTAILSKCNVQTTQAACQEKGCIWGAGSTCREVLTKEERRPCYTSSITSQQYCSNFDAISPLQRAQCLSSVMLSQPTTLSAQMLPFYQFNSEFLPCNCKPSFLWSQGGNVVAQTPGLYVSPPSSIFEEVRLTVSCNDKPLVPAIVKVWPWEAPVPQSPGLTLRQTEKPTEAYPTGLFQLTASFTSKQTLSYRFGYIDPAFKRPPPSSPTQFNLLKYVQQVGVSVAKSSQSSVGCAAPLLTKATSVVFFVVAKDSTGNEGVAITSTTVPARKLLTSMQMSSKLRGKDLTRSDLAVFIEAAQTGTSSTIEDMLSRASSLVDATTIQSDEEEQGFLTSIIGTMGDTSVASKLSDANLDTLMDISTKNVGQMNAKLSLSSRARLLKSFSNLEHQSRLFKSTDQVNNTKLASVKSLLGSLVQQQVSSVPAGSCSRISADGTIDTVSPEQCGDAQSCICPQSADSLKNGAAIPGPTGSKLSFVGTKAPTLSTGSNLNFMWGEPLPDSLSGRGLSRYTTFQDILGVVSSVYAFDTDGDPVTQFDDALSIEVQCDTVGRDLNLVKVFYWDEASTSDDKWTLTEGTMDEALLAAGRCVVSGFNHLTQFASGQFPPEAPRHILWATGGTYRPPSYVGYVVGTLMAVDNAGDKHNFTIATNPYFEIVFNAASNSYNEVRLKAAGLHGPVYYVDVTAFDSSGLNSTITINITSMNVDPSQILLDPALDLGVEWTPPSTGNMTIAHLYATDMNIEQNHTFSIVSGYDGAVFNIEGNALRITQAGEGRLKLKVLILASDGKGGLLSKLVEVRAVQLPPYSLSFAGSRWYHPPSPVDATVGSLIGLDWNQEELTYSVVGGPDASRFYIHSGNKLAMVPGQTYNNLTVTVRVSDHHRLSTDLTIMFRAVNVPPTGVKLPSYRYEAPAGANAYIGELTAIDDNYNDTHTFAIIGGRDANLFTIVQPNNLLQLAVGTAKQELQVTISVTDPEGLAAVQILNIYSMGCPPGFVFGPRDKCNKFIDGRLDLYLAGQTCITDSFEQAETVGVASFPEILEPSDAAYLTSLMGGGNTDVWLKSCAGHTVSENSCVYFNPTSQGDGCSVEPNCNRYISTVCVVAMGKAVPEPYKILNVGQLSTSHAYSPRTSAIVTFANGPTNNLEKYSLLYREMELQAFTIEVTLARLDFSAHSGIMVKAGGSYFACMLQNTGYYARWVTQTPSGLLTQTRPFTGLSELPQVLALKYEAGNITCTMTWTRGDTVSFSELDVNITASPGVPIQAGVVTMVQDSSIASAHYTQVKFDQGHIAIKRVTPSLGAIDVASGTSLVVEFDRQVTPGVGSLLISKGNGPAVAVPLVNCTISGTTLTYPLGTLDAASTYFVELPAGLVRDSLSQNEFQGLSYRWAFASTPTAADSVSSTPNITMALSTTLERFDDFMFCGAIKNMYPGLQCSQIKVYSVEPGSVIVLWGIIGIHSASVDAWVIALEADLSSNALSNALVAADVGSILPGAHFVGAATAEEFPSMHVTLLPDTSGQPTTVTIVVDTTSAGLPVGGQVLIVVPSDFAVNAPCQVRMEVANVSLSSDPRATTGVAHEYTATVVGPNTLGFTSAWPYALNAGADVVFTITGLTMPAVCWGLNQWVWGVQFYDNSGTKLFNYLLANPSSDMCNGQTSYKANTGPQIQWFDDPDDQWTYEDTSLLIGKPVTVKDDGSSIPDNKYTVTLSLQQAASKIRVWPPQYSYQGVVITGGADDSAMVQFTGSHFQITYALANLRYTPAPDFFGVENLTVIVNDNGYCCDMVPMKDVRTIPLYVIPVNDAPVMSTTHVLNPTIVEGTNWTFSCSMSDIDAGSNTVEARVSVTGGTIFFGQLEHGVIVYNETSAGTTTKRVRGTMTDLNKVLSTIIYLPQRDETSYYGPHNVTCIADDLGHGPLDRFMPEFPNATTPNSTSLTSTVLFRVNIIGVNDPPLLMFPINITTTEDTPHSFRLMITEVDPAFSYMNRGPGLVQLVLTVQNGTVAAPAGLALLRMTPIVGGTQFWYNSTVAHINSATFQYVPAANFHGRDLITAAMVDSASDGMTGPAYRSLVDVPVFVQSVNDPPIMKYNSQTVVTEPVVFHRDTTKAIPVEFIEVDAVHGTLELFVNSTSGWVALNEDATVTLLNCEPAPCNVTFGSQFLHVRGTAAQLKLALAGLNYRDRYLDRRPIYHITDELHNTDQIYIHVNDMGLAAPPTVACVSSTQCNGGVCSNGLCQWAPCVQAADCTGGKVCSSGFCKTAADPTPHMASTLVIPLRVTATLWPTCEDYLTANTEWCGCYFVTHHAHSRAHTWIKMPTTLNSTMFLSSTRPRRFMQGCCADIAPDARDKVLNRVGEMGTCNVDM